MGNEPRNTQNTRKLGLRFFETPRSEGRQVFEWSDSFDQSTPLCFLYSVGLILGNNESARNGAKFFEVGI